MVDGLVILLILERSKCPIVVSFLCHRIYFTAAGRGETSVAVEATYTIIIDGVLLKGHLEEVDSFVVFWIVWAWV